MEPYGSRCLDVLSRRMRSTASCARPNTVLQSASREGPIEPEFNFVWRRVGRVRIDPRRSNRIDHRVTSKGKRGKGSRGNGKKTSHGRSLERKQKTKKTGRSGIEPISIEVPFSLSLSRECVLTSFVACPSSFFSTHMAHHLPSVGFGAIGNGIVGKDRYNPEMQTQRYQRERERVKDERGERKSPERERENRHRGMFRE